MAGLYDDVSEMIPGSNAENYPEFALTEVEEKPRKASTSSLMTNGRQPSLKWVTGKQCMATCTLVQEEAHPPAVTNARWCCKRPAGIIMDSHLNFRDHIQSLLRKANGLIVRHYPILAALTPDNLRVGLTMYKALIRSVITYAAPAWEFAAVSHLRKLQVVQNQVIRLITHLPESPREESSMMN
ncbi:hypothetical protein ANN_27035 [Periplaneta americana]|uniref:RNA-directed DNA polymerase from mobile element jockey n=1 Tax=Periplaneta americana TaxID=6978 RepID=A0ABQ8RWZ5_PERAM|nr:hypothetical protein ANN_27035 [Periplaneta americana]